MPAYFNISLQFKREDIYPSFMKDFYAMLAKAGMNFKSGHWGFETNSCKDITEWNQKLLENDFVLGYTEHHSHDYRQALFDFCEYSEVRGFWLNRYPDKDTFSCEIIIPEDDVLDAEGGQIFKREKVTGLILLAKELWKFPSVQVIQTGLEGSDASTGLKELCVGIQPNVLPFCMIRSEYCCFSDSGYDCETIPGMGKLLINRAVIMK